MSWPLVKLEDVSEFIRNGASIKQSGDAAGLPITRIETIADRTVNLDKCGYADVSEGEYINYRLRNGDILISHINSERHLAKCAIFESHRSDVVHGMNLLCLRPSCEVAFPKYLFHYLSSSEFLKFIPTITKKSVNQASFTVTAFKGLEIPLPPLPEQKRIAAILDKADAIRRKRQQAIQLADDFLRAVFLDMFGDPRDGLKIEDMLSQKYLLLHKDGNHGSNYPAKEEFGDDGVVFISAKDISDQDGSIDYASVAHLNESKARKLTIGWLKEGDVLLAHNATVGRVGLFSGEVDEALIGTSLTAFRPNQERLSSVYLFAALKYSGFQAQLKQNMGQSTRNQVPITAQRALKIPVGDLKRQRQFERVFIKLKQVKSNLYAGLKGSDEMFSSLSQRAFSGQL